MILIRLVPRWFRSLSQDKRYRVIIGPAGSEFANFFRDLIQYADRSIEEQNEIGRRISQLSSASVAPAMQLGALIAESPLSLPAELEGKWWSPFATPILNKLDPPDYELAIGIMRTDKTCGLSVRLLSRERVLNHWQTSCEDKQLPAVSADLAFQVVTVIRRHRAER
jgi:hypothetical protein